MKRTGYLTVGFALWAALISNTQAGTVINPVDISLTGADAFFPIVHLIDGTGLDSQPSTGAPVPTSWNHQWGAAVDQNSWVSSDPGGFPADWFEASGTIPRFVIDLGQEFEVEAVHLWPYAGSTGANGTVQANSAKTLEFRFNTAAQGDANFLGAPVTVQIDHGPVNETAPGFILPQQAFAIGNQTAQFVEMLITDNWFVAPGDGSTMDEHGHLARGGDRIGLGEVRFSAVPEPSTWALLATALTLFMVGRLRRKQT
jgi:hypothetical protein